MDKEVGVNSKENTTQFSNSYHHEDKISLFRQLITHFKLVRDAMITSAIAALIVILIHTNLSTKAIVAIFGISLGYALGFAINDYFDAPYDKLREDKANTNYFVKNKPTFLTKVLLIITLTAMIVLFGTFGIFGILILIFSIFIMLLYSVEPIRFKTKPGLDVIIHAIFVETYPYILPILLLQLQLLSIDLVIIPILLLNSAINQLEQQKRDYSIDNLTHNTFVTKFGKSSSSKVIKILNTGIFIILGIAIVNNLIPSLLIPQIIIALPLTLHRYLVGPEENRSRKLYTGTLLATVFYWSGVILFYKFA